MDVIFINPIVNLFLFLYKALFENFVLAILVVTFLVQMIFWPFTIKQYKENRKMRKYQEHMKKIQEKRASGKELNVEEMQMMTGYFKSACFGCLPLLIQMPFLFGLFDIFSKISSSGGDATIFNKIAYSSSLQFADGAKFNLDFFGLDLSKTLFTVGINNVWPFILLLIIVIATIAAQYYSMKMSNANMMGTQKSTAVQKIDATKEKKGKNKKNNEKGSEDIQDEMQKTQQQMTKIITFVIFFFSITSAAALSIYWLIRSIFVIIQTTIQNKYIIRDK